jgi:K+/H+ antiporter YhaU regulatory subunit KhtT
VELQVKSFPQKCEIISEIDTETYLINERTSSAGRSIKELRIRSTTGATVIAIRRGGEIIPSPEPDFIFKAGDVVYLIGKRENVLRAIGLLES